MTICILLINVFSCVACMHLWLNGCYKNFVFINCFLLVVKLHNFSVLVQGYVHCTLQS